MKANRLFMLPLLLCLLSLPGLTQPSKLSTESRKLLRKMDDSLKATGDRMLDDTLGFERLRADSLFTRQLVRALRVPYSFYFRFDSMQMAPVLYPPDSAFRIITWHYTPDDINYRQKGAIQMNTPDGNLKLFPLFDASEYSENLQDSIRTPQNWIGAVYYAVVQKEAFGKKYYTLIGYDENNDRTTRKWIDVLWFDDNGEPRFGANLFAINNDSIFPPGSKRYLMEYRHMGRAKLNYDAEEDMVIMDHLMSPSGEPEKKYTLVPGGDYEGMKWGNNRWQYIPMLAMESRGDGNEPRPELLLDDTGLPDETKLQQQSEKNMKDKKLAPKSITTVPPKKKN